MSKRLNGINLVNDEILPIPNSTLLGLKNQEINHSLDKK